MVRKQCKISGEKKLFHRKAPACFSVECGESAEFLYDLRFLAVKKFFHCIHRISYKKETPVHGFEPLSSCISTSACSNSQSVTYLIDISCEFMISVEFSGKISDFSETFFSPHSPVSGNFFPPHSADSAVIFFHRILLVAVKNFLSPLKR